MEEQKRRRAKKIDSARQLDLFADLNLGPSDDDESAPHGRDDSALSRAAIAPYALMLGHDNNPSSIDNHVNPPPTVVPEFLKESKKNKKKRKNKNKLNKWADKCMYAELLEMTADDTWSSSVDTPNDGLPSDLESAWVAVGPVPVGKRCLAVTHQSSGITGNIPNTTLRSRLLGKVLIQRFPSVLPPFTILDCILDGNWRENGILHVLDVVKWKGQDVSNCETSFRFWWRDTRLTELAQSSPPVIPSSTLGISEPGRQPQYVFPYPTTFLPIPYHTDTTLSTLLTQIIPFARSVRAVTIDIPTYPPGPMAAEAFMDIDNPSAAQLPATLTPVSMNLVPDGLLLYVAEASYEAGGSPLSSWIPIERNSENHATAKIHPPEASDSPLDLFQRLVQRRILQSSSRRTAMEMEM